MDMKILRQILFFGFIFLIISSAKSQKETDERAYIDFHDGIGFQAPDSMFFMNLRFRMQNRAGITTDDDFEISSVEATVRRLRLRFDGFVLNPKLTYYLQLAFSLSDQDWDGSHKPNIVRDALIHYHVNHHLYFGFGQGKLPGNRQRVISSGSQQFADRSIVNNIFTLDRDFGAFLYYTMPVKKLIVNVKGAISSGEGRNISTTDKGLCYTGRVEVLPFGKFKDKGDYFEGDLLREPKPKLSIAATWAKNEGAIRTEGQRGHYFIGQRNINTFYADMILKYNGWAFETEYAKRDVKNPFVIDVDNVNRFLFVGEGINQQISYCFKNNFEIAGRYSFTKPYSILKDVEPDRQIFMLGLNKYIIQHKTKLQFNVARIEQKSHSIILIPKNTWNVMFQIEIGI